jgi:polyphosphate kinase
VPRAPPRVIRLPAAVSKGQQCFVLLTSVIRAHLSELFSGREVVAFSQFRVTRNADIEVDDFDVTNLRQALRLGLATRQFGKAVRLEVVNTCPEDLSAFLLKQFNLPASVLYLADGPVNLVRLSEWVDGVQADDLRFTPLVPAWPQADVGQGESMMERMRRGDMMLHLPFQSFAPVVQLLREAVNDPDVVCIKQTVYRTGADSELMHLLIEAARRGKEVTCVVEIKARFDEEANIDWAERLEAVGAQVVYGIVGMKTHGKLLLITRREGRHLRRYVHLSTGNYNPKTARFYTDVGYFSAEAGLTGEADAVFQQLASQEPLKGSRYLVSAPFALRRRMLKHLKQVQMAAAQGKPGRVVVKCNAMTDPVLIAALQAAALAGAKVDLVIRGACLLAPAHYPSGGTVLVRSIIGRFLEHTRIFYFSWGPHAQDEVVYLSSADWMTRNMMGRIELAWPVRDAKLSRRVIDECLQPYLHDKLDAWEMQADGSYQRARGRGASAQQALSRLLTTVPR